MSVKMIIIIFMSFERYRMPQLINALYTRVPRSYHEKLAETVYHISYAKIPRLTCSDSIS